MATHSAKVLRLYRQALKTSLSWAVDRSVYRQHALSLRAKFDQHKNEKNVLRAAALLEAGQVRSLCASSLKLCLTLSRLSLNASSTPTLTPVRFIFVFKSTILIPSLSIDCT